MDIQDLIRQNPNAFGADNLNLNPGMSSPLASNASIGIPQASFDQSPSPINRNPNSDAEPQPQLPVNSPVPPAVAGPPNKPASEDDDDDDSDESKLGDLMVTKQDLKDAQARKQRDLGLAQVADALSNQQGWGNMFLHSPAPHVDAGSTFRSMAKLEDQPIEAKQLLLKQALQGPSDEFVAQSADPNSSISKILGSAMAARIQQDQELTDDQKQKLIESLQGKSGLELNKLSSQGPLQDMFANDMTITKLKNSLDLAQKKLEYMGMAMQHADARAEGRNAAFQGRTDIQGFRTVADDNDIKMMTTQSKNIQKAIEQMNDPTHPPSWTQMAEVAQDISAALSGKQVSSDFKLKEIKKGSVDEMLGNAKAAASSNPDQPANPATVTFWMGMAKRLDDVYDRQIKARGEYMRDHSPKSVRGVFSDAAQPYIDGSWKGGTGGQPAAPANKISDDDQAALQHIKDNPNDPHNPQMIAILKSKGIPVQ